MTASLDLKRAIGQWQHAHEEDGPGTRVFRRTDVELPPSRGRSILEIGGDLAVLEIAPGPDDRPEERHLGPLVADRPGSESGPGVKVISIDADRIVVRRT
jgi:hypothetical protein